MIINNLILAAICNDIKHATKYSVDTDGNCFYKCEKIGKINEKLDVKNGILNIYFQPIKAIEYIAVNFTISPTEAELKE
jgi:hypothetical protein